MAKDDKLAERRALIHQRQIDHIGVSLWTAADGFVQEMYARIRANGFQDISMSDSEILPHLEIDGSTLTELAKKRGTSRQAMHQSVHSLIKRGYLSMEDDPRDKRARLVQYTKKGLDFLEALQQIKVDLHQQALDELGERKTDSLRKTLGRLATLYRP